MSTGVHSFAQVWYATETSDFYDKVRPSYPQDSVRFIKKALGNTAPLNIVEIGAGTGLFTRSLLADKDDETKIASIKAIEPSAGMREVFKQRVTHESVTISDGTFDDVSSVDSGWADLVIVAQAFHWCPDFGKACAEFARILKPSGVVALIWNMEDRDAATWVAQIRDCIEIYDGDTPRYRLGFWRQAFSTKAYSDNFKLPEEKEWVYHIETTADICLNRALSKSYTSLLSPNEKLSVSEDIKAIVSRGDGRIWIDESKGVFEYPYKTLVVLSRRK